MMRNTSSVRSATFILLLVVVGRWWLRRKRNKKDLQAESQVLGDLRNEPSTQTSLATLLAHAGCEVDRETGALTPPIHLASTFERDADLEYRRKFIYGRIQNPTRDLLERTLARLEGGTNACTFATGSAAAAAVLQSLPLGCVLIPDDMYHGNRVMVVELFSEWGLKYEIVNMSDTNCLRETVIKVREEHGPDVGLLIWTETPSNPQLKVTDLVMVSRIAEEFDAIHLVDATWLTPVLCRPLDFGCDLVMHSTTKYLGGHSDHLGGAIVVGDTRKGKALFERVVKVQRCCGAVLPPFDCWLLLRGLRSLSARMMLHSYNALHLAAFLEQHPAVERVFYPGLSSHPSHKLAVSQVGHSNQFGGMLSFLVKGGEESAILVGGKTQLIKRATSLGGTETLIEHRSSVEDSRSKTPKNLLRVSVGLECVKDLIEDLKQALDAA